MKKSVSFLLIICLIGALNFAFADEVKFVDIETHWAKEYINTMLSNGSINGYNDGFFYPDKEVTIAEFLKMFLTETDAKLIKIGNQWPDWYMVTALSKGYISEDELENPNMPLTRIKACEIIAKYIGLDDVQKGKETFTDIKNTNPNKDVISKLVKLGIVSGYKDGTFKEDEKVTRAQACKLIVSSYNTKNDLSSNRKYELTQKNTNIGDFKSGDIIKHRYEIKNKRIYIKDEKRYGSAEGITLNQEYIDDSKVIELVNTLVDDDSYTEVYFVPDKYIINSLNICYGQKEGYVDNGIYYFQVRFYENSLYDVAKATDSQGFSHNAFARIELDRMWEKSSDYDSEFRSSNKSLIKLEKAIEVILDKKVKDDVMKYMKEKIKEAIKLPDDEFSAKIEESRKFGKFQIDVLCVKGTKIELYISKI